MSSSKDSQRVSLQWTSSFNHVLIGAASIVAITWTGVMDTVATENGIVHYAERPFTSLLPSWLPMPLNTLINFGYTMVGFYWLTRANSLPIVNFRQKYMFSVFSWMTIFYSIVQTLRIVFQTHRLAVLDQWYTLPIFMWTVVWGLSLLSSSENVFPLLALMITSCFTYFLALITEIGFEIGLGAHILLAITIFLTILFIFPSKRLALYAVCCFFCCLGFVILKLYDHHLPSYSPIFRVVSGHFISKICDVGQIYYSAKFFESAVYTRNELRRKLNKTM